MPQGLPRVTFPNRLYGRVAQTAERWGIDPSDVVELVTAAGLPTRDQPVGEERDVARELCRRFDSNEALELSAVSERLLDHKVGLLRMGPIVSVAADRLEAAEGGGMPREDFPLEDLPNGYRRRWMGMAVSDSPLEVWQAARGYWRLKNDLRYLVPTRLGYAPHVYRIERWERFSSTKFYAESGWLIYPEAGVRRRLLDPEEGGHLPTLGDPEPADAADLSVGGALAGQLLRLGERTTNPVIRL